VAARRWGVIPPPRRTITPHPTLGTTLAVTMRHFLDTMNMSLHISGFAQTLAEPLREKDTYIMGVIISLPNVSKSDLRAFS
jgi:hypothetical protein